MPPSPDDDLIDAAFATDRAGRDWIAREGDYSPDGVAFVWAEDLKEWIEVLPRASEAKKAAALRVYKAHSPTQARHGADLPANAVQFPR